MDTSQDSSHEFFTPHQEDHLNITERKTYLQCSMRRICSIFWRILLGVLILCAGMMVERYYISNKTNKDIKPEPVAAFSSGSSEMFEIYNSNDVYRLDYNSPGIICRGVIKIYYERKHCRQKYYSRFLKSKSSEQVCYKCGDDCYVLEDLLNIIRNGFPDDPDCNTRRIFDCCLLSYMGNLMNQCVDKNDSYACYNDNLHKDRLLSRHEPMCENPYYEKRYVCKCFHSRIPVCGQDNMIDCDHFDMAPKVLKCRMNVTREGQLNNCICGRPLTEDEVDSLESCEGPNDPEALTNGSAFPEFVHPLLVVMLLKGLYVVGYD